MKLSKNLASKFVLVATFAAGASAHAGVVSPVIRGGMNLYAPSTDPAVVGAAAGKGYLAGAGLDIGVGPASVLVDVFYAQRKVEVPAGPLTAAVTMNSIYVPVQGQLSMGLFHISGGGYYAMGIGKVAIDVLGVTTEYTYAEQNVSTSDFGAVAGIGVGIPLGVASLSIDVRGNYGLKDLDTSTSGKTIHRSLDLLVGIRF